MLRSAKEIKGYVLHAEDADLGRTKDFLFDDETWTIRYMVADTARWLPGRKVLISPISLDPPDWATRRFPVKLTKSQIESAPDLTEDAPVSRQYEVRYHAHYGWPIYWGGPSAWGAWEYPAPLFGVARPEPATGEASGDEHLRSVQEVSGYVVHAVDGDLGKVADFVIDDQSWTIRYLVVDTKRWLPGRQVLVAPDWIEKVSWIEGRVHVALTEEELKASPEFDPGSPVNREYERRLYDFYGRPCYWG